jgi:3-isopropylmalate/(R)-2-methylmalate dehydratase small subunit
MEPWTNITGVAAPLLVESIDTDVISPMNRLLEGRDALLKYAFEPLRYRQDGTPNPDFVLNQPEYQGARILLAGANFACGSSRETAVWAIVGLGFRCVIAPSFGDIFFKNCFQNGVLPVVLLAAEIRALASETRAGAFQVDLERCKITAPSGREIEFVVHPLRRAALLAGLDEIGVTLERASEISAFQKRDREARPWIYSFGPPAKASAE